MTTEWTYDEKAKTLTIVSDGVGMDGKPAKWKSVSQSKDDDTTVLPTSVGGAKEQTFAVTYTSKKK
jgi:hypothetical protein